MYKKSKVKKMEIRSIYEQKFQIKEILTKLLLDSTDLVYHSSTY